MSQVSLTREQKKGVKASIVVVMLVLVLFLSLLLAGRPIMYFGSEPPSAAYAIAVYVPVMAVCALAYRRLGTS